MLSGEIVSRCKCLAWGAGASVVTTLPRGREADVTTFARLAASFSIIAPFSNMTSLEESIRRVPQ